jgi:DNA-binding HxlR family transcriptional regulator
MLPWRPAGVRYEYISPDSPILSNSQPNTLKRKSLVWEGFVLASSVCAIIPTILVMSSCDWPSWLDKLLASILWILFKACLRKKLALTRAPSQLEYQADPLRATLKLFGKKWTLLIVRDVAFLKLQRFGQILANNPGLTPRVLSRRLDQMASEGLIKKETKNDGPRYFLTPMGEDAVYILLAMLRFGIRHYMGNQDAKEEEKVVSQLRYDIPKTGWVY